MEEENIYGANIGWKEVAMMIAIISKYFGVDHKALAGYLRLAATKNVAPFTDEGKRDTKESN